MNLRRLVVLGSAAILAVCSLGQSARAGSATIQFDPTGTGSAGLNIDQWNLSNTDVVAQNSVAFTHALSVGQTGGPFTTTLQGIGNTFSLGGNPQALATGFALTAAFPESATLAAGSFNVGSLTFTIPGAGSATLNNTNGTATLSGTGAGTFTWIKPSGTPSLATGTGFTTGTTVATGSFFNIAGTSSGFTSTGTGTLGGSGTSFPSTTSSVIGNGSETIGFYIANPSAAFFPSIPAGDGLLAVLTTTATDPFGGATATSNAFFNGHTTTFPASGTNGGNGTSDTSGDFLFQGTNPAITFYLVLPTIPPGPSTPEPGTLLLCAAGFGGLALVRRLRRRRAA